MCIQWSFIGLKLVLQMYQVLPIIHQLEGEEMDIGRELNACECKILFSLDISSWHGVKLQKLILFKCSKNGLVLLSILIISSKKTLSSYLVPQFKIDYCAHVQHMIIDYCAHVQHMIIDYCTHVHIDHCIILNVHSRT